MIPTFLRPVLCALSLALLLSCGGGSGTGGGTVAGDGAGTSAQAPAGSGSGTDGSPGGDGSGSSAGSDGGSTGTAANGSDDGSGVGSGGTGATAADAGTSVGSVDGMGSIFVGGVRYDTDKAVMEVSDGGPEPKIGMTVAVTGPVDSAFTRGTARKVLSMAQMRGVVDVVHAASFEMLGSTVSVDENTVWADLPGLGSLSGGMPVQVWALPVSAGELRATRIESSAAASQPLVTGTVSMLDASSQTFQLGSLVVDYRLASVPSNLLANGRIVRVTGASPAAAGRLDATKVEGWYALSSVKDAPVQLEGVITDFASATGFRLMGIAIDASTAQVAQPEKLGNGVTVVASGKFSDAGVLVATRLRIQHVPGGGAQHLFNFIGPITSFTSIADMVVRNQRVDASNAVVVGSGQLTSGTRVSVQGSEVAAGVLRATQLTFE